MLDTVDILSLGLSLIPLVACCVVFSFDCKTESFFEGMIFSGFIDMTLLAICWIIMLVKEVVLVETVISGIMLAPVFFGKADVKYNNYEKHQMMSEIIFSYCFMMFFIMVLKYVY